jgi:mycothiol system anti-sigma-R factor
VNHCDEQSANILLYLDNALTGQALEKFCAHLAECPDCKASLEEERALSSVLRKSRPLYSAPDALRARVVAATLQQAPETTPLHEPSSGFFARLRRRFPRPALGWKPVAATIMAVFLSLLFVPGAIERARANGYVETAMETHRSYLNGELPLQIMSDSPEVVAEWFTDKTAFHFRLPASQPAIHGKPAYRLTGARLVKYKGNPIALVAYETGQEKISLLVASSKSAVVAGGEEVRSGGLTFHYRSRDAFKVITWTNHGLTYALVSSLSGSAQHSCLVCHQDAADQTAAK